MKNEFVKLRKAVKKHNLRVKKFGDFISALDNLTPEQESKVQEILIGCEMISPEDEKLLQKFNVNVKGGEDHETDDKEKVL